MRLCADCQRLTYPVTKFSVHIRFGSKPEYVDVVPMREGVNQAEARTLYASRKDQMSINPGLPRRQLREGHSDLECDPRLFRQDVDSAKLAHGGDEGIEDLTNLIRLAGEVLLQRITSTGMALIPIREFPPAFRAFPERAHLGPPVRLTHQV